ncbi:MAG: hypothetical protein WEB89_09385 [Balneolales bacterium]
MNSYNRLATFKPVDVDSCLYLNPDYYIGEPPYEKGPKLDIRKLVEAESGAFLGFISCDYDANYPKPVMDLVKKVKNHHPEICRLIVEKTELPFLVQVEMDWKISGMEYGATSMAILKYDDAGAVN